MRGEGNSSSHSTFDTLLENLAELCQSDSLSEKGLREIIRLHGRGAPNDPNIDDNNNYEFFLDSCGNEKVTEGILRDLLKCFPNAARHSHADGFTSLHIACENKHVTLGMVQLLIDAFPESVHHEDNTGCMPLHRLCCNENLENKVGLEILKLLLEKCPESVRHTTTEYGTLPIHLAALRHLPEFCRVLIEAYPGSERMTDNLGRIPFHAACRYNTVATVKYLYQLYPESINVAGNDGTWHPLHLAFSGLKNSDSAIELVRFLLGCNPDAISSTGRTPLHIICYNKNVTLKRVQLLIDAFPDSVHHEDNNGFMPLHRFCCNKTNQDDEIALEILKLLIEKCPEAVKHATRGGMLPIHTAAKKQSPEFCRILIEAYPGSERITNDSGSLPFHRACRYNTVATAKYLYELYPESINVADNRGVYPIHFAVEGIQFREGNSETAIEMVQFLLDCDPNLVSQKVRDKPPVYWVCKKATNENTRKLNAYLKVLQTLYDIHPEVIDEVASNMDRFCQEVQTFINTQLTFARQVRGRTVRQMKTRDENGQVPLHRALRDIVTLGSIKLLVKRNPSAITCADNSGALPLHVACQHCESRIVEYLVGLDPDTLTMVDKEGNTALHHACRGAKFDTSALLLGEYGAASVSKRNAHNKLPIHLLLESNEVRDREDTKYVESIYRLLRAYPETLMHCTELQGCLSQNQKERNQKKRKIDEV